MTNDLHQMAAVGDVAGAFEGATADNALGQARNAFDGAEAILARFRDAATEADQSRHLTDIGKLARKREAAETAFHQLGQIKERSLQNARLKLGQLQGELGVDPIGRNDLVAEMRSQEVRRHLLSLDQLEREIRLAEAVEVGDETTLAAFFGAPAVFRIVAPQKLDEARQQWIERRNPAKAREAEQLRRAVDAASAVIDAAGDEIRQGAGLLDDPTAAKAAGTKEPARVG